MKKIKSKFPSLSPSKNLSGDHLSEYQKTIIGKNLSGDHLSEYQKTYSYHKDHYWKRKLKNFDLNLLNTKNKLDDYDKENLFKNNVDNVLLELSSFCNRECIYCPVKTFKRNYEDLMPDYILDNIISSLKKINYNRSITLNLYNEPFYNTKIFINSLQKIRKELPNCILGTHSNGDYLNKNILNELAKKDLLQKLKITIHPPKQKKWTYEYIRKKFINFLKKLDVKFSINDLDKTCSLNKQFQFFTQIQKLSIFIQGINFDDIGTYRGGAVKDHKNTYQRSQPCVRPFREFTVYYDGTVTKCCDAFYDKNYQKNKISQINKTNTIFNIYNNQIFRQIRTELFDWGIKKDICSNCSNLDLSNVSDGNLRNKTLEKINNEKRSNLLRK